jgi:hypothetical protein
MPILQQQQLQLQQHQQQLQLQQQQQQQQLQLQQQQQQQLQDYYRDANLRPPQKSMSPALYNEMPDSRTGLNESSVHDNTFFFSINFKIIRIPGKLRSIFIKIIFFLSLALSPFLSQQHQNFH